ncbi:MAG: phosphoribosylanthranilate isomerase [Desulfovibrio sp.]|nr:phosphoribosylanthranilate isomerase [Desulfovibrio sp.]MBI4958506.1 phosphoribosylanthranilate isomerase [Desulfovibrio sp.]
MSVLVKVCGMTLPEQVAALDELGVDFLGFIFAAKSPRKVTPGHVAAIPRGRAKRVGVFVGQDAEEVRRIIDVAGLDYAQLHAGQDEAFCRTVGTDKVIKVFWPQRYLAEGAVTPDGALEALRQDMQSFKDVCALMLLDSGTSGGGHGKSLDFSTLSGLSAPKPWLLAGGLSPDNAAQALLEAKPSGLDLNSGVEISPGIKDISRVEQTFHITKSF